MTNKIELTDKAIRVIQNKLDTDETITYLRVGVRGSGCSGYSFYFEYEVDKKDKDLVFQFKDVQIIIDPKSLNILGDFTLDYHNSLMKAEFNIRGDNIKSSCGCGKSFSTK